MSDTRYTATQDIYAGPHVLAYRAGQEVPASAVESLHCQGKVTSPRVETAPRKAAPKPAPRTP